MFFSFEYSHITKGHLMDFILYPTVAKSKGYIIIIPNIGLTLKVQLRKTIISKILTFETSIRH